MANIVELESIIVASSQSSLQNEENNRLLNELRSSPNRWSVGLELFLKADSSVAKFFGLSLVRDYVDCTSLPAVHERKYIRETIMNWIAYVIPSNTSIPVYIVNNVVTIVTRVLKLDFPTHWSEAFTDVLSLANFGVLGVDIAVRVIAELDIEVIMFDAQRTAEEVQQNMLIKDTMRDKQITKSLIDFLCRTVLFARENSEYYPLCIRCLQTLSTMIGWVDINLIANEQVLVELLYPALRHPSLSAVSCTCIFELVKKGMDPLVKTAMVTSIGLMNVLPHIPLILEDTDPSAVSCFSGNAVSQDTSGDLHKISNIQEFSMLIDLLFQETLLSWNVTEEAIVAKRAGASNQADVTSEAFAPGFQAVSILTSCIPFQLKFLSCGDTDAATSIVPSLGKMIGLQKLQKGKAATTLDVTVEEILIEFTRSPIGTGRPCFIASNYVQHELLMGLYSTMQFDEDFEFDLNDEEDCEEIEAKKQFRKLFVNCCRSVPKLCLELMANVFQQLPQPLSTAPFSPLEAALRLVHAFGECGLVSAGAEGSVVTTFSQLLVQLHQTDVGQHAHTQVMLSYFEVSMRYVNLMIGKDGSGNEDYTSLHRCVTSMLGTGGLRHPTDAQLRSRTAYLLLKIAESLQARQRAHVLMPVLGTFGDLILTAEGTLVAACTTSPETSQKLTNQAELYLLETVGIVTSNDSGNLGDRAQQQHMLFAQMLDVVIQQMDTVLQHPQFSQFPQECADVLAHKVNSLASLSKGRKINTHENSIPLFIRAAEAVIKCLQASPGAPLLRLKSIVFIHRMVPCMKATHVVFLASQCVPMLIQYADTQAKDNSYSNTDQIIQMVNQLMIEYKSEAVELVCASLPHVLDKITAAQEALEKTVVSSEVEAPHISAERSSLIKLKLLFLNHVANYGCQAALYQYDASSVEKGYSSTATMTFALAVIEGSLGHSFGGSTDIAHKKSAVGMVMGLSKVWLLESGAVPSYIRQMFMSMMYDRVLPSLLQSCYMSSDPTFGGKSSLALQDAQVIGYVSDIGALLYTIVFHSVGVPDPYLTTYLQTQLLVALHWPASSINALVQLLSPGAPTAASNGAPVVPLVGTYKESFKKLIRSMSPAPPPTRGKGKG